MRFITRRSDGRIAVGTIRILLVLTCGILLASGGGVMACIFRGGIVSVNTGFVPAMLTATVINPIAISVRTMSCTGREGCAAIIADASPLAVRVPNGFGGRMVTRPHCVQCGTRICGIASARLIGRTCRGR